MVRCATTADFLAAFPFIAGFTASESLFLVCFEGSRSKQTMRVDLPDPREPRRAAELLDALCDYLRATGAGEQGPAIVITTGESFAASGGAPRLDIARMFKRRFRREGWRLRDLAVIASDGWAGLLDPSTPKLGRPLAELEANPIADGITAAGRTAAPLTEFSKLPEPDPQRAAAVVSELTELDARHERRETERAAAPAPASESATAAPPWLYGVARVAETCFAGTGPVEPRLVARLAHAAEHSDQWLVLALTAASRAEFVISLVESAEPGCLIGAPVDIEAGAALGVESGWSMRRLLFSLSSEQVDPLVLERVIDVLGDAAAHLPPARRSGLLALLAWAWWMRGMSSVAAALVEESRRIDAEHEISAMVERLIAWPAAWVHDPSILSDR